MLILVQLLASQNRYRLMSGIAVANFALKAALNAVLAPRMARRHHAGDQPDVPAVLACYLAVACAAPNPKRPTECPPFKALCPQRVLFIHSLHGGGAERVAVDLSAHWARQGATSWS